MTVPIPADFPPRLGLLSDTHGNLGRTRAAIRILTAQQPAAIIHCGDIGAEGVLVELAAAFTPRRVPVYAVLGNVDLYDPQVAEFPPLDGLHLCGRFADLEIAGKRLAVIHGDDRPRRDRTIASGDYDYVLTGHTHQRDDVRGPGARVINPGAVHRANPASCATLNLASEQVVFLDLFDS